MTTRTETQPVAGQHRPASRLTLDQLFPAQSWRWVGTAIRVCAALVLLYCAMGGRG